MRAAAAIAEGSDWRAALEHVLQQTAAADFASVDLAVLFASPNFIDQYGPILEEIRRRTHATALVGCSGQAIIGPGREVEDEPALSLLLFSLPGAVVRARHVKQEMIGKQLTPREWRDVFGLPPDDVNAWLLFADPFSLDPERLLAVLSESYPGVPLMGGMASGDLRSTDSFLFLNDTVLLEGAVALAIGGPYTVHSVVSQGCEPIGETWTITGVRDNVIESIGMRPALEVLAETFGRLPPETQQRARKNLLVGLAMDEYRDDFRRGDFLIRHLSGVDQASGAIAIDALPRVGQTVQFQIRDGAAADDDLVELLTKTKRDLGGQQPLGALLYTCNGRGIGLFAAPDHDARRVAEGLGPIPLAGLFCRGEIGPVGQKHFLHGFTASLAIIVPKGEG
jgi:small ligand-binding sensory domain FIST